MEKHLFTMRDLGYRDFHSKLMPNIDKNKIIGIRVPVLRKFAKQISGSIIQNSAACFTVFEFSALKVGPNV